MNTPDPNLDVRTFIAWHPPANDRGYCRCIDYYHKFITDYPWHDETLSRRDFEDIVRSCGYMKVRPSQENGHALWQWKKNPSE